MADGRRVYYVHDYEETTENLGYYYLLFVAAAAADDDDTLGSHTCYPSPLFIDEQPTTNTTMNFIPL